MAYRRSAFVPRMVLKAGFASVVPALALIEACSSSPVVMGVAAVAYCCFEAGLGDGDANDAVSDAPKDVATDVTSDVATDAVSDSPKD